MDENIEFLNYIYQNADMGKEAIEQILKEVEDLEFREILKEQLEDYEHIVKECDTLLISEGKLPKDIEVMPKIMSYLGIRLNTLKDDTTSHIAEMLIEGSNMGITDITKKLNKYDNVNKSINDLANRLLKMEQKNIEVLKPYL